MHGRLFGIRLLAPADARSARAVEVRRTTTQSAKQVPRPSHEDTSAHASLLEIVERQAHHRVWAWTTPRVSAQEQVAAQPHRYIELAVGMHYQKDVRWGNRSR